MIVRELLLTARFEIVNTLGRRSFWLTTFLLPAVVLVLVFVAQSAVFSGDDIAVDAGGAGLPSQEEDVTAVGYVDLGKTLTTTPRPLLPGLATAYEDENQARAALAAGDISRYYLIPGDYVTSGRLTVVAAEYKPLRALDGSEFITYVINTGLTGDENLARLLFDPTPELRTVALAPGGAVTPKHPAAWTIAYFIFGYLAYASLYATLGALASKARDANQFVTITIIPLIVPLLFSAVFAQSPDGALATTLSLFPLTSPVAMVARLGTATVPWWQSAAGLVLLAALAYLLTLQAARSFSAENLLSTKVLDWQRVKGAMNSRIAAVLAGAKNPSPAKRTTAFTAGSEQERPAAPNPAAPVPAASRYRLYFNILAAFTLLVVGTVQAVQGSSVGALLAAWGVILAALAYRNHRKRRRQPLGSVEGEEHLTTFRLVGVAQPQHPSRNLGGGDHEHQVARDGLTGRHFCRIGHGVGNLGPAHLVDASPGSHKDSDHTGPEGYRLLTRAQCFHLDECILLAGHRRLVELVVLKNDVGGVDDGSDHLYPPPAHLFLTAQGHGVFPHAGAALGNRARRGLRWLSGSRRLRRRGRCFILRGGHHYGLGGRSSDARVVSPATPGDSQRTERTYRQSFECVSHVATPPRLAPTGIAPGSHVPTQRRPFSLSYARRRSESRSTS